MVPPQISLVKANLIKVSYDSLQDHTASLTISGSGPFEPVGVSGYKNPIEFFQDEENPLKFYASYLPESLIPADGDSWTQTNKFTATLTDSQLEHIDITVVIFGNSEDGEKELAFNFLLVGFGSAQGDAEGEPL
jgi:hypothetical protein